MGNFPTANNKYLIGAERDYLLCPQTKGKFNLSKKGRQLLTEAEPPVQRGTGKTLHTPKRAPKPFGRRLYEKRKALGLTRKDLAELMDVCVRTIEYIEDGRGIRSRNLMENLRLFVFKEMPPHYYPLSNLEWITHEEMMLRLVDFLWGSGDFENSPLGDQVRKRSLSETETYEL